MPNPDELTDTIACTGVIIQNNDLEFKILDDRGNFAWPRCHRLGPGHCYTCTY